MGDVGGVATTARITIPVDADRDPEATVPLVAALARDSGADVEFVAAGPRRTATRDERPPHPLLQRCRDVVAAGAPTASWAVLDHAGGDVGAYATWSGSSALCLSTRRHGPDVALRVRDVVASAAVPVLVAGPRARRAGAGYRRLVVGLDASATGHAVAVGAIELAKLLALDVLLTEVVPVVAIAGGDVHESAWLHRLAATVECAGMFDILHNRRPAEGIVRFVGCDERSIIAVGMPVGAGRGLHGHVARAVLRHAPCPVLLVPVRPAAAARWRQVREAS